MLLYTSVKSSALRYLLIRGTVIGGLGVLLWLFSGIFLPVSLLKSYGFPIVFAGILLIAIGMIPYQKLKALETNPNSIEVTEDMILYNTGKKRFEIPIKRIREVIYIEKGHSYGIGLRFHGSEKDFDFFFPYFSKKVQTQLTNEIKSV